MPRVLAGAGVPDSPRLLRVAAIGGAEDGVTPDVDCVPEVEPCELLLPLLALASASIRNVAV